MDELKSRSTQSRSHADFVATLPKRRPGYLESMKFVHIVVFLDRWCMLVMLVAAGQLEKCSLPIFDKICRGIDVELTYTCTSVVLTICTTCSISVCIWRHDSNYASAFTYLSVQWTAEYNARRIIVLIHVRVFLFCFSPVRFYDLILVLRWNKSCIVY